MKLTEELKNRIVSYFESIDPNFLAYLLISEFGFVELKKKKKLKKHKSGSANIPSPPPPPFDRKLKEGGYVTKPEDFNIFKK